MIRSGRLTVILLFLFFGISLSGLPRFQDFLEIENWVFLDAVDGIPAPLSVDDAKTLLVREAQWLVAGSIYGFSFRYVPLDRQREIPEVFELQPLPGKSRRDGFSLPDFRISSDRCFGKFLYSFEDYEYRRYSHWHSNIVVESFGKGSVPMEMGQVGVVKAHEAAIKEALRSYFRLQVPNKPQRIEGTLAISSLPVTGIDGGEYVSSIGIRIRPGEVRNYDKY